MSNTESNPEEHRRDGQNNGQQKVSVPEKWEHVEPALVPLFEATLEWFEYIYEQFYFSTGGVGQATHLTPNGVEFSKFHCIHGDGDREFYQEVAERYENNETIEDTLVVNDREAAIEAGEQATWLNHEGRDEFWISEYVPFEDEVTTTDELAEELSEIMVNHPDFDELFEETATVADEIFHLDDAE